jgi:cyclohexanecarboxylate-CoA ligase
VPQQVGIPLRAIWGMTEAGGMFTRLDDPADIVARSVGRPAAGLEVRLIADATGPMTEQAPGRDLAVPDGQGGYRHMGRAADRIGGALMIPVADVEDALREHPAVADAALIGVPGEDGGEIACAVIQAADGRVPVLETLRLPPRPGHDRVVPATTARARQRTAPQPNRQGGEEGTA